jgi:hypothetical protein
MEEAADPRQWWREREAVERARQKYFHFLLHPFTQPDELFGPIEISMLRKGVLVRVNFGMLTGAGVRAAFLDEVFKGTGSILNTLLTLTNERKYFNWGKFKRSDLVAFIGASNEMPGAGFGGSQSPEADFPMMHAFLDRFVTRLHVPIASSAMLPHADPVGTDMSKALAKSLEREGKRFRTGEPFNQEGAQMPSMNDLLLLGRFCFQGLPHEVPFTLNRQKDAFFAAFMRIAAALRTNATNVGEGHISWSISPRKLRSLYKVALAYSLVLSGFTTGHETIPLNFERSLRVFQHIWDTGLEAKREELAHTVESLIRAQL